MAAYNDQESVQAFLGNNHNNNCIFKDFRILPAKTETRSFLHIISRLTVIYDVELCRYIFEVVSKLDSWVSIC